MREQGRWVLGWGHSTAGSPLELEHANGGRETKDGMKGGFGGTRAAAILPI